ncbi:MAG: nucleotidyltransferase domain-containing protein [Candidatus Aenigmatarchaeota archaeon]
MLKKGYKILEGLIKTPWKRFTFKEIKRATKNKSDSYVFGVLKGFVKQGILLEEKAGNVVLYYLNISSLKTQIYTGFVAEYIGWSKRFIPYKDLEKISKKIPNMDYVFVITGSYANNTQKKNSDIDVVILIDDSANPKKVYAELQHVCELNIPQIHLYVFKNNEFLAMLNSKKANYGKEIVKNNLILAGGQFYMRIISEAMENGFND